MISKQTLWIVGVVVNVCGVCLFRTNGLGIHKYRNHKILRVHLKSPKHFQQIKRSMDALQVDVLGYKEHDNTNRQQISDSNDTDDVSGVIDLLISPSMLPELYQICKSMDIRIEMLIPDIPKAILDQLQANESDTDEENFSIRKYNTLPQINMWLSRMANSYPDIMTLFSIGQSSEGRPLHVVKLTRCAAPKPVLWMDAGIHSNEWIAPSTLLYFIQQFIDGKSEELNTILDNYVIYIMPVLNVDGYHYTWTEDRFWRKSRSHTPGSKCVGVDLNRNWDVAWDGHPESVTRPCSRTFAGPAPFSEAETRAVSDFLARHNESLLVYIAYHSYSQFWMTPYGFSATQTPSNVDQQLAVSHEAAEAIRRVHGTHYTVGSIANLIGVTSGSSVDYVYSKLHVPFTFGVELRDAGRYGALVPPEQLVPNGEESLAALKAVCRMLRNHTEYDRIQETLHKGTPVA